MNTQRIPEFDSIQDLARFWGTHDLTDFEDELEEVTEPVFERETVVEIRLPFQEAAALKEIAKTRGVGYSDLIREWVLERIHVS